MYLDVSCYVSSVTHRKRARYMYLDVSDVYPKMYLGLVWDTCKIHAICQDTCILLECNRAFKIHLRYIRIHSRYVYPTGYMQDTCRIHQNTSGYVSDRKLHPKTIGNPPAPGAARALGRRRTDRSRLRGSPHAGPPRRPAFVAPARRPGGRRAGLRGSRPRHRHAANAGSDVGRRSSGTKGNLKAMHPGAGF